jgi:hypothetical protein
MTPLPQVKSAGEVAGLWLLLKAFASGCTALTGVEAVSNGVKAFREPTAKVAQRTLAIIIVSLVVMLGGIAFLVEHYGIIATAPNSEHYQSVLSLMFMAVAGRGWFYYLSIGSVLLVLIFSANTAFADFPRVCRIIAEDRFLPISLAVRGRRLVYSEGILVLAVLAGALLVAFGGVTDRLIPLYAVGAFLAFTLSQAGMVAHWRREGGPKARRNMIVNGVGTLATGATVIVVIIAKFAEGAWITVVTIPAILALMYGVRRHYDTLQRELSSPGPLDLSGNCQPIVIIPVQLWSKLAKHALCAALAISKEITTLYVTTEETSDEFCKDWNTNVAEPVNQALGFAPQLVILQSPYRFVVNPIVDYVLKTSAEHPNRRVIAIVPELVEHRWYNYFLHSQRSTLLKTMLLVKGNDRVSVLNIPWYFK